jgi:4-hydroxybenzoate polyprenyltransferase
VILTWFGYEDSMNNIPQDAIKNSIVNKAPAWLKPYLQLSRFDRPIGFWLLGIPCLMGQALGRIGIGFSFYDIFLVILWAIGTIAMRGAGCTINDLADKDFDKMVERTAARPLPSGAVTTKQAYIWLGVQLLVGLIVLLLLPKVAQIVALWSIPMFVAYPFMKRITWWPQAWLGMTFNWGVLVGYAAVASQLTPATLLFWLGGIFWTLGYDTIYAMSDVKDDALIGVKSTARKFGDNAPDWVKGFYIATMICFMFAILLEARGSFATLAALPLAALFALSLKKQYDALVAGETDFTKLFRQNKNAGLLMTGAIICVVLVGWYINTLT